jgi:asparaginyl-tRNA synthetase
MQPLFLTFSSSPISRHAPLFCIEVPLQVLLALASSDPAFILSPTDKPSVEAQAKKDIASGLATVEKHLSSRSFVATAGLTVADVSLFVVASQLQGMGLFSAAALPALGKWYAAVASATGSKSTTSPAVPAAPPAPVAAPAPPAAGAAAVAPPAPPATTSTSIGPTGGKWKRNRTRVKELLAQGEGAIGSTVTLKGWVRTSRSAEKGTILFVEITDGSSVKGVQLVLNASSTEGFASIENCGGVGASLSCTGTVVASPAKGQVLEIHASSAVCIGPVYGGDKPGEVGGKNYPMAKKAHSLEYLREKAHLRIRSKMFSSAMRMRNAMAYATNLFFQERGFILTHTPLITGADCEGAGEQFVVTTLLPEHAKGKDVPLDKAGNVDFSKDFFGRRCCMTVSGQLNVETHAHGLSDVYTFGPTFRAENSHTARHLAEFWMIEPEICFAELEDDMALAEDYVKFCTAYALAACPDDLHYFEHEYPAGEKGLRARLENVANSDFARITYSEAVELLQREIAAGKVKFERNPSWGDDLGSEHERYITEQVRVCVRCFLFVRCSPLRRPSHPPSLLIAHQQLTTNNQQTDL